MQITDIATGDNTKLIENSLEITNDVPLTYIREAQNEDGSGFAVCSENGEVLACFSDYDSAFYTARQFRLEPLMVH